MTPPGGDDWADRAVEAACARAEEWYLDLPAFSRRVNLGSVVGFRHPAIVSEQDCVMHFARFLNESGAPWEAIHHQLSVSRWLFDSPHPAASAGAKRWRVDLALLAAAEFGAARLPAREPGFAFDSFLEFAYLGDSWRRSGYVIAFEECHYGFPPRFATEVAEENGCRVRFVRGYRS
jgi:hypothetical protein